MKTVLAAAILALTAGVPAAAAGQGVWVNGTVHPLATSAPQGSKRPVPLYIISPVSPSRPLHSLADSLPNGYGAHDHVAARVFAGPCDLMLVVPGPRAPKGRVRSRTTLTPLGKKPLAYAVVTAGKTRPLTSATAIHAAVAAGLVTTVDTDNVIFCRVGA